MSIRKLLKDQRGVGTIDYALIASLISIAAAPDRRSAD